MELTNWLTHCLFFLVTTKLRTARQFLFPHAPITRKNSHPLKIFPVNTFSIGVNFSWNVNFLRDFLHQIHKTANPQFCPNRKLSPLAESLKSPLPWTVILRHWESSSFTDLPLSQVFPLRIALVVNKSPVVSNLCVQQINLLLLIYFSPLSSYSFFNSF